MRGELEQYLSLNDDLPRETVLQMAPFALYYRIGKKGIEDLFKGIRSATPYTHQSWFWWQCLVHSGRPDLWFADELNAGKIDLRTWRRRLIYFTTDEEEETLLRRFYKPEFDWNLWHPKKDPDSGRRMLWTKGGVWNEKNGMTKILVLRQHIERPRWPEWGSKDYLWPRKLTPEICRSFERDLWTHIDPDQHIYPEAYDLAVERVRNLTQPLSKLGRMEVVWASWFFQQRILHESGYVYDYRYLPDEKGHPIKRGREWWRRRMHPKQREVATSRKRW